MPERGKLKPRILHINGKLTPHSKAKTYLIMVT